MSIPLRLLLDPAYALPVKEKPKMGANLDLDDVVAGHPKAQQELDELRARVAELEAQVTEIPTLCCRYEARIAELEARVAEWMDS